MMRAIVTGGTRGIGAAISLCLKDMGFDVEAWYRWDRDNAEKFQEEYGIDTRLVPVDDFRRVQLAVDEMVKEGKTPISVLVNNAGVVADRVLHNMDAARETGEWDRVLQTNLYGVFYVCHAVIPIMREQKAGAIINISSVNALTGCFGQANYTAAKAGLIGLTRTIALENASNGINANVICPGYINTDMTKNLPLDIKQQIIDTTPLRRFGDPEDVALAVEFLVRSPFVTGATIHVNGGRYMG